MKNLIIAIVVTLAVIAGGFFVLQKDKTSSAPQSPETTIASTEATTQTTPTKVTRTEPVNLFHYEEDSAEFSLEHALSDRYIGSLDAPVVFHDFSSLSCPHCATFHNKILPTLKKDFIETGNVRMIFELMPLNPTALMGEQIARCIPKKDFYKTITLLYSNQELWAFSKTPRRSLVDLVKLAGITPAKANACLDNKELEFALSDKARENAFNNKIKSTPTFVFKNGAHTMKGVGSYSEYAEMLKFLIEEKIENK